MTYVAFIGFAMMILITYLLLKQKVSAMVAFTVIPIIAALLVGASSTQITKYIIDGLNLTVPISMIIIFSLPFFTLMDKAGVFDTIVKFILKHTKINAISVCIVTVIVAAIIELDGSVVSAYVITIPLMLPLYKKLKIDPKLLLFLCSAAMCVMFTTPWNARTLRASTVLKSIPNAPNVIFTKLLPLQIAYFIILIIFAVILAKMQMKKNSGIVDEGLTDSGLADSKLEIASDIEVSKKSEFARPKMFFPNVILVIAVVIGLTIFKVPNYFVFAMGLIIALFMNYRGIPLQNKVLKQCASEVFPTAPAILLSGVVVGVLQGSGMMAQMVTALLKIVPNVLGSWIYIIIALLSVPLMFIFTNDTWYYVLIPIVAGICAKFGVPTEVVVLTLMMNVGAMLSPVAQPQIYLACEMADNTELSDYIKFSFAPFWMLSIIWTVLGIVFGILIK